mgnify:CR=1 FL=1
MRTFIVIVFILFSFAPVALAVVTDGSGNNRTITDGSGNTGTVLINPLSSGNCNPTNTDCLGNFLINILRLVVRIGSIVVVLMYVFVGFKFVTAQGNETKITEAKKMLLWTTIGALVLLGAEAIARGIQATVQGLTSGGS